MNRSSVFKIQVNRMFVTITNYLILHKQFNLLQEKKFFFVSSPKSHFKFVSLSSCKLIRDKTLLVRHYFYNWWDGFQKRGFLGCGIGISLSKNFQPHLTHLFVIEMIVIRLWSLLGVLGLRWFDLMMGRHIFKSGIYFKSNSIYGICWEIIGFWKFFVDIFFSYLTLAFKFSIKTRVLFKKLIFNGKISQFVGTFDPRDSMAFSMSGGTRKWSRNLFFWV